MMQEPRKGPTILVPTDFSELANLAIDRAMELALAVPGTTIVLLHVIETDEPRGVPGGYEEGVRVQRWRATAEAGLRDLAREEDLAGRCIHRIEVIEGRPALEIVRYAQAVQADLIVMSTHGRRGLARLFAGSVAEAVVRTASCEVLVVRSPLADPAPAPRLPRWEEIGARVPHRDMDEVC